jgi:hypothetical protein
MAGMITCPGPGRATGRRSARAPLLLVREAPAGLTLGQAVERYLGAKARKRSIKDDARHLAAFVAWFGGGTPLAEITAARISAWKAERLAGECPRTRAPYSAAAINRPLAALRHLLQFFPKPNVIEVIDVGVHENFYRELQRYLDARPGQESP